MSLYDLFKEKERITLAFHKDADGVFSAALFCSVFKDRVAKTECPFLFGDYNEDLALDLGAPLNTEYSGVVVDHHPNHPENRKYILFWDYVPTSLIVYRLLREHIPRECLWYVVGGLTGDNAPELTPPEVWDSYPELLDDVGKMYRSGGETKFSRFPVFNFLSSSVNALCRLGRPIDALRLTLQCRGPLELVESQEVLEARERVNSEVDSILRDSPKVWVFKERYVVTIVKSSNPAFSISGLIASRLVPQYSNKYTVIVVNEANGEVSIRGLLAGYLVEKLSSKGWKVGGHAAAAGGNIDTSKIQEFIQAIRESSSHDNL